MPSHAFGTERREVAYSPRPASHLWIAICLGLGGAALAIGVFLGLSEVLYSFKQPILEAILSTTE